MVGFRIPFAGFRIPKRWIPDSTDQNYLDSGFQITLHGARCRHSVLCMYISVCYSYFVMSPGRERYFLFASNARKVREDVSGLNNYVATR